MSNFIKMIKDESGASAAEYALMIALVGGLIITATVALSGGISGVFNVMGSTLTGASNFAAP